MNISHVLFQGKSWKDNPSFSNSVDLTSGYRIWWNNPLYPPFGFEDGLAIKFLITFLQKRWKEDDENDDDEDDVDGANVTLTGYRTIAVRRFSHPLFKAFLAYHSPRCIPIYHY